MGKNSGYVEKRKNSLRIAFYFKGELQRESVKLNGVLLPPTKANYNYATRLLDTINTEIARDTFNYAEHFPESPRAAQYASEVPKERTFGVLADLWHQSKGKLTGATKDQYGTAVRFWKRMFGADTPLSALDASLVEAKVGSYEWSSPKQHNNYMIALRGIFGMEYRGARAIDDPSREIENLAVVRKLPDPLTPEERDRVLADLRERYDVRVYAYFLFAFLTGMRPEELIALRWSDIDFNAATARVRRVRTFKGSERDGSKTHAEREVDLVDGALHALDLMKPYTFMLREEREGDDDNAADIFQNPITGKPWHDERSQRDTYWRPCLKRLGIRWRRAYCTRHTFTAIALSRGVWPQFIANQAGHSLPQMMKTYARWIRGADGGAAKALMRAAMTGGFSPNSPQPNDDPSKSLSAKEDSGRRDWIRTKKSGSNGA